MISGIVGGVGSGKSTVLTWLANRAVNGKAIKLCGIEVSDPHKYVYTNFQVPGCLKLDYDSLGKADYRDSLIIIDEAMMFSDCRDFKSFGDNLKFFYRQHRKYKCDVIWASQTYDDLDKKIRTVTSHLFHVEPLRFSFFKVKHVEPFFDIVSFKIIDGYQWGKNSYIYGKPVFKLFNSLAPISAPDLIPPSREEW